MISAPSIRHEMLVANAGSGKTFRLTIRTITLLALGVKPEKIAALTFTRKAAGEFLEAVFRRLAKAAMDTTELDRLQSDTHLSTLSAAACRKILADLAANIHRLNMGTIDSLFGKIAHAFPLETGLAGDFSILSTNDQKSAYREVLAAWFRENAQDETRFRSFLEIVRQQSRIQSERQVFQTLLKEVEQLHGKLLRQPTEEPWGHHPSIWPDGSEILAAGKHAPAAEALVEAILATHPDIDPKVAEKWEGYLGEVCAHVEEQNWNENLKKFVKEKLCSCKTDAETNRDYLPHGNGEKKRIYLNETVLSARRVLLLCLLRPRIEQLLKRSRSLHAMMKGFEEIYGRFVRNQGRITFEDITLALAGQVDSPEWRATVGYRLDTRFDHWLLDEFQDTSRAQWKVLGALIDEVVQDDSGSRSFFYVGDTKQAIYAWRGGDAKLFFEIRDHYNGKNDAPIVAAPPLNVSFRSDPEIIEIVNQIFGNLAELQAPLSLPQPTVRDWTQAWVPHDVASKNRFNQGYFRWQATDGETSEDESADAVDSEILAILLEVRPWQRGWSCAALKRDNKKLESLSALLQSHGIPVTIEGKANPCTDNPLGVALLAAFRFAASPADKLSHVLLASCPLGDHLLAAGEFIFRDQTLRLIAREGFAGACEKWMALLDLASEPFLAARGMELLAAAEQFDAGRRSSDDIGSFVTFLENYQRQEPEGTDSVRLMTIHQAKGLTLDMVIVSGLDSSPIARDGTPGNITLQPNRDQKLWGMLMPETDISRHDDVLHAAATALLAESTYGELCAIYVALTRPRHALYIVTKKLKEGTTARNFARMLDLTLGQTDPCYERGNRLWYDAKEVKLFSVAAEISFFQPLPVPRDGTPHAIFPSSLPTAGSSENSPQTTGFFADATALGTEIHSYLAKVEWVADGLPSLAHLSDAARQMLEPFFATAVAQKVFTAPDSPVLLWRERAFDILLRGDWITGVFDRVQIALDDAQRPISATVFDFKTDLTSSENLPAKYENQLSLYREATARILGLELSAVQTRLIALR